MRKKSKGFGLFYYKVYIKLTKTKVFSDIIWDYNLGFFLSPAFSIRIRKDFQNPYIPEQDRLSGSKFIFSCRIYLTRSEKYDIV